MKANYQIKQDNKILLRILLFSMALISQTFSAHTTIYASQSAPKQPYRNRDIYVVYDNSGSMLNSNEVCDSPWYEAAYAVELVASVMEEGDRLHIYFMKDSSQDQYFSKEEYIQEKESLGERIREDLSAISYTNNTYADGLFAAVKDLKESGGSNRKILIILSDGEFNTRQGEDFRLDCSQIEEELGEQTEIIYLALAKEARKMLGQKEDGRTVALYFGTERDKLEIFEELFARISGYIKLKSLKQDKSEGWAEQSWEVELPAEKLAVLEQWSGRESPAYTSNLTEKDTDSMKRLREERMLQGLEREDIKYDKEQKITSTPHQGVYSEWIGKQEYIEPGTCQKEYPADRIVTVFAKYDVGYRIEINDENGTEWRSDQDTVDQPILRSGHCKWKVNLFDELSEKTVEKDSELYDHLRVTIETGYEGESEEFDTREETVSWREGVVQLTARMSLDGLMEEVIERQIIVEDPLEVEVERINPKQEIDIDEIEDVQFKVMNKEENISSQVEVYVEEPSDGKKTFYEYTLEYDKKEDLWRIRIRPKKKSNTFLGEESVQIRVEDKADGEIIAERKKMAITYYATDKTLEPEECKNIGVWDIALGKTVIEPNLMGEPLVEAEQGIEELDERLEIEEPWNELLQVSRVGTEPVKYTVSFRNPWDIFTMWSGVEMQGCVEISGRRYGQMLTGSYDIRIQTMSVLRWCWQYRWTLIIISFALLLLVFFVKWVAGVCFDKNITSYYIDTNGNVGQTKIKLPVDRKGFGIWMMNFFHPISIWSRIDARGITNPDIGKIWVKKAFGKIKFYTGTIRKHELDTQWNPREKGTEYIMQDKNIHIFFKE